MTPRPPALDPYSPEAYRLAVAKAMSEAVLQEKVIGLARSLGYRHYHPPRNKPDHRGRVRNVPSGWPDLVLAHPRLGILYRELKQQHKKPEPEQTEWLELLCEAGGDAGWWRPLDLLEGRIEDELKRGQRR